MKVRGVPAAIGDDEALTDLQLDVCEEAYADLMPASVFTERRARRADRVASWSGIIAAGSSDDLLAWSPGWCAADQARVSPCSSAGSSRVSRGVRNIDGGRSTDTRPTLPLQRGSS